MLKKYELNLNMEKSLGKPYSQQLGRKYGKGAGKVVARVPKNVKDAVIQILHSMDRADDLNNSFTAETMDGSSDREQARAWAILGDYIDKKNPTMNDVKTVIRKMPDGRGILARDRSRRLELERGY